MSSILGLINVFLHVRPVQKTTQINRKSPRNFHRFQIGPLLRFNSTQFNSNSHMWSCLGAGFISCEEFQGKITHLRNVFPFELKSPTKSKLNVLAVFLVTR